MTVSNGKMRDFSAVYLGFVFKIDRNTYLEEKHFAKKRKKKPTLYFDIKTPCVCACLREEFLKFRQRPDILFISGKTKSMSCSSLGVPGGGRMNQWV